MNNTRTFGNVTLGFQQLEDIYQETINLAMDQNAGLAIAKLRKKGFEKSAELVTLNDKLNEIMLKARGNMRIALNDYLLSLDKSMASKNGQQKALVTNKK